MARDDFKFKSELRVRFGETDLQGVVYNANYFIYIDSGQMDYIRHLGISYKDMQEQGHDIVIADVQMRFMAPAYVDEVLEVFTRISQFGHSSMEMEYEMYELESGRAVATAKATYVIVETKTGRPVRAPHYLRSAVREFEKNPEIDVE